MKGKGREVFGLKDIRRVVVEELRNEVAPDLSVVRRRMLRLESEVWNVLKGVGRSEEMEDLEWVERSETFLNWELWGTPGSGYEHLPKLDPKELVRKDRESIRIPRRELDELEKEKEEHEKAGGSQGPRVVRRKVAKKKVVTKKGKNRMTEEDMEVDEEVDEEESDEDEDFGDEMDE